MSQNLTSILSIGPLLPAATTTVAHGLLVEGSGVVPDMIMPDRATPIVVTATTTTQITFRNDGTAAAEAVFEAKKVWSGQRSENLTQMAWQGVTAVSGGSDVEFIRVDDYADDIQAAVNAAAAGGIPLVVCNPTKTYTITALLSIPVEVILQSGMWPATSTSDAPVAVNSRATIVAGAALPVMIELADYAGIRGFYIDGDNQGTVAIQCVNAVGIRVRPYIGNNYIKRVATGIKLGGATYPTIENNSMNQITGIGLDALASYGGTYYGLNAGISRMNAYDGDSYRMRIEGILTSIADTVEGGNCTVAHIATSGTNTSYLTLIDIYCEGVDSAFYKAEAGAELRVFGGFIDGDVATPGTIAFDLGPGVCDTVYISGLRCQQFDTVFDGTIPTVGFVIERNCEFATYTTFGLRDMTLFGVGHRSLEVNLPAYGIAYDGTYEEWLDGTVANFDCVAARFHEMALTVPATITPSDSSAHLLFGHIFTILFDGNTTINHGVAANNFNLISGINETPAAGVAKQFVITSGGLAREIG